MISFQGKEELIRLIQRVKNDQNLRSKGFPLEGMRGTSGFSSEARKCLQQELKERAAGESGKALKELRDIFFRELE